jgi:hypothetical protein
LLKVSQASGVRPFADQSPLRNGAIETKRPTIDAEVVLKNADHVKLDKMVK